MKFAQYVGKGPMQINKVVIFHSNHLVWKDMRFSDCCVCFAVRCISLVMISFPVCLCRTTQLIIIPPVYEVYRGYIVFAFSVRIFVCLSVCLSVNFFSVKDFSETT